MTVRLTLLFVLATFAIPGCSGDSSETTPPSTPEETRPAEPSKPVDRLHQSFKQATRKEPLADSRPPERTHGGKSIGILYEDVVRLWDSIKFTDETGNRIHYTATLETAMGDIVIELDDEKAPNHVRNFIALSKAGYYDGMMFDHILASEHYEEIQAGSPLGAENPTRNSIGYWLNPEISTTLKHGPGAVGACRSKEKDTAGVKFYIALNEAEEYDGNYTLFGKVTRGLDVAQKIGRQPVIIDEDDPSGIERPLEPVVIKKVTIHTR